MNPSKLETLTGAALLTMPLASTRMIIEGLVPQGLHILGGAPKIGKSWLTLWLCLRIAQGEPVWNLSTEKGDTLYLCLEDSFARIQNRLLDFTALQNSSQQAATLNSASSPWSSTATRICGISSRMTRSTLLPLPVQS